MSGLLRATLTCAGTSADASLLRFCFEESVRRIRHYWNEAYRLLLALALFDFPVARHVLGQVVGNTDETLRDESLIRLLRLSLVNRDWQHDQFTMLPLTRLYVQGEMEHRPALQRELEQGWIQYATSLAQPYMTPRWLTEPDPTPLQQEGDYLAELATWAQQTDQFAVLLALLPALSLYYFDVRGDWSSLESLLHAGLAYAEQYHRIAHIICIKTHPLRWIHGARQEFAVSLANLDNALQHTMQLPDPEAAVWRCDVLRHYALTLRHNGAYEQAAARCAEAMACLPHLPSAHYQQRAKAGILLEQGKIARDRAEWGNPAALATFWKEAEETFRKALRAYGYNDTSLETVPNSAGWILIELAYVLQQQSVLDGIDGLYHRSKQGCEESWDRSQITRILHRQVDLAIRRSDATDDQTQRLTYLKQGQAYAQEGLVRSWQWGQRYEQGRLEALTTELQRRIAEAERLLDTGD